MSKAYIVTGTDTGIGKTTVAAMLVLALDAVYWKPIQSGTEEGTDRQRVQALTQLPDDRLLPERYVLSQPLSPHRAAELDGIEIKAEALVLPAFDRTLVIEGAGGLMVPVTRDKLQIDAGSFRADYLEEIESFCEGYRRECFQIGVDYVRLDTSMQFDRALTEYLISRRARY